MIWLLRFIPGVLKSRSLWIGIAAAFAAGSIAGGWAVAKFHKAAEVAALEKQMEEIREAARQSVAALDSYYTDRLAIAEDQVTIREVIRHVPTDPDCDVSDPERRMLNRARRGVPEAAGDAAGEGGTPAPGGKLSRPVEVAAHADCGIRFRQLKARHDALVDWINRR